MSEQPGVIHSTKGTLALNAPDCKVDCAVAWDIQKIGSAKRSSEACRAAVCTEEQTFALQRTTDDAFPEVVVNHVRNDSSLAICTPHGDREVITSFLLPLRAPSSRRRVRGGKWAISTWVRPNPNPPGFPNIYPYYAMNRVNVIFLKLSYTHSSPRLQSLTSSRRGLGWRLAHQDACAHPTPATSHSLQRAPNPQQRAAPSGVSLSLREARGVVYYY